MYFFTDEINVRLTENNDFLEISHDILSLEVYYSTFLFVKEGKEIRNTQYYRIGSHVS